MNKADLVEAVAANKDLGVGSKAQAQRMVDAVIEGVKAGLKKGEKVQIVGFGSFTIRERKARMGRNPSTGEPMKIAASRTVGFSPGQALKDLVNKGGKKGGKKR